ncbi:phosphotransferase enzyme family protein [Methyloglobulus sp.]|uniref:phosphotransferase enzyme family protein n=1 Tax=Methyloglobulus sp. TaxID=2518622 RepID=UPI003988D42F
MLLLDIAQQFSKSIASIDPLGNGFINDTYLVTTDTKPFVLQKINKHVFPQPEQVMANLMALNQHIGQVNNTQITLKIPQLLTTRTHSNFFRDGLGDYWRALSFIENTESLETVSNLAQAGQVGFALGQFHRLTHTLDSEKLYDILPGFHITPGYLGHYQQVKNRAKVSEDPYCADFISRFQHIVHDLETAKELGLLSVRVIHGDPKLNNFLFDKNSQRIVSLVDLDTVKPGLIHYDIGDCLRSCCHNTITDEFNLAICQKLLSSYLREMGELFSASDYQFLYPAIRLVPFELGIRFYTDYLEGNHYFKVTEPEENLNRATGQFLLCASVMAQEAGVKGLINQVASM